MARGLIPIVPYASAVERIEFLTDVIEHRDGTEQRIRVRPTPRRIFQYAFYLKDSKKAGIYNLLYDNLRGDWYAPVWPEMESIGTVTSGQTVIPCDTTVADYTALAFLYDTNGYEVVEIESLTDTEITLTAGAEARENAYVMPLKEAFIQGSPTISTNGLTGIVDVNFHIEEPPTDVAAVPGQYLGEDIYYPTFLYTGQRIDRSLEKLHDLNDFDLGLVAHSSPWLNSQTSIQYSVRLETPAEVQAYKEFLYRRAGRYRGFWCPTLENDLRLKSTGTITDTFQIYADNFGARDHIAVRDTSGNWYPREVTGYTEIDSSTIEVTVDSALNLASTSIDLISYLGYNRLGTDRVELKWNPARVVKSQVLFTELNP